MVLMVSWAGFAWFKRWNLGYLGFPMLCGLVYFGVL